GGDPDVVGRTIIVNGHPFTIIGIAPAGFNGTTVGSRPVVFVPITMRGVVNPGFAGFENRRSYWVYVFGRLKEGVTLEQAKLSINAVYRPIINDVEVPLQQGMLSEQWMNQFRSKEVEVTDGRRGQSSVSTEVRTPMLLLMGTTLVVLLIACANIANLLLARGANRGMEMAVRLSIGANRRQVISQLLTESVLLGAMGAVGGVVVAWWTLSLLGSMLPPEAVQSLELSVSGRVITVAAVLGVATGLLFGIFPALHALRPGHHDSRERGQPHGHTRRGAIPRQPRDRAGGPVHRAAHPGRPVHAQPGEHRARGSRPADREHRDVRYLPAAQRLQHRALAPALPARRGGARSTARRDQREQRTRSRPGRKQLGLRRECRGLRAGS